MAKKTPTKKPPKLKSFHFDCGNSTDGPVGFCARVRAPTKKEALLLLGEAMPETIEVRPLEHDDVIEYIHVYTNTDNVKVKDIDDGEDVEDES